MIRKINIPTSFVVRTLIQYSTYRNGGTANFVDVGTTFQLGWEQYTLSEMQQNLHVSFIISEISISYPPHFIILILNTDHVQ